MKAFMSQIDRYKHPVQDHSGAIPHCGHYHPMQGWALAVAECEAQRILAEAEPITDGYEMANRMFRGSLLVAPEYWPRDTRYESRVDVRAALAESLSRFVDSF